MKKTMFTLAAAMFAAGSILSGCFSDSKKVENAEQKVQDAKSDVKAADQSLVEAKQTQDGAVISDYQKFKNESTEAINENDRRIAKLRIDIKNEKAEARAKDEKKIDALEKKNRELREKLEAYHDDGKSDWKEFKKEFNHDLAGIGNAFKDITVRNTN